MSDMTSPTIFTIISPLYYCLEGARLGLSEEWGNDGVECDREPVEPQHIGLLSKVGVGMVG